MWSCPAALTAGMCVATRVGRLFSEQPKTCAQGAWRLDGWILVFRRIPVISILILLQLTGVFEYDRRRVLHLVAPHGSGGHTRANNPPTTVEGSDA